MSKKKSNWLSYLPVATVGMGLLIGGLRFQLEAKDTKTKVEKLETKTEIEIDKIKTDIKEIAKEGEEEISDLKSENKDLEKKVEVNKTQQDNMQAQIQQISEKTDKIVDLLIEIKQRKK